MEPRWTRIALENLDQIAVYIAQDKPLRAAWFVGEIKEKTELLLELPSKLWRRNLSWQPVADTV